MEYYMINDGIIEIVQEDGTGKEQGAIGRGRIWVKGGRNGGGERGPR